MFRQVGCFPAARPCLLQSRAQKTGREDMDDFPQITLNEINDARPKPHKTMDHIRTQMLFFGSSL